MTSKIRNGTVKRRMEEPRDKKAGQDEKRKPFRLRAPEWFSSFLKRRTDAIIASAIGLLVFTQLLWSLENVGIGRDEGIYMTAGQTYWHWVEGADFKWNRMRQQQWLDDHYGYNWEHPPLVKHLAGLSWRIFHRCNCPDQPGLHRIGHRVHRYEKKHKTLGLLSELQAFRLPTVILTSILVALIYLFGAAAFGRPAGLVAALLYITMPRVFFHSRLAAFDAPVTATMFFAVFAYWKALHKARWAIPAGLLFGVALSTKLNAFFLPLLLAVHYAYASRDRFRNPAWASAALLVGLPAMLLSAYTGVTRGNVFAIALAAALMIAVFCLRKDTFKKPFKAAGLTVPAVFWLQVFLGMGFLYLTWPRLWPAPIERFGEYLAYHLHHVYYNTEYLGQNYNLPPFPVSFPFVMTLITVPGVTCLLAILGLTFEMKNSGSISFGIQKLKNTFRSKSSEPEDSIDKTNSALETTVDNPARGFWRPLSGCKRSEGFLVGICALFPLILISVPSTPIFGGTRTWMPAMPYIALLAGIGFQTILTKVLDFTGWAEKKSLAAATCAAACLLVTAPGFFQTIHAGDIAPSYYTPIIGGPRGAATIGTKRQYWGYTARQALDWINRELPERARLYPHDTMGLALDVYKRDGLLKKGIQSSGGEYRGVAGSQYAIFQHEMHQVMWEFLIWQEYGTFKPSKVMTIDGVPLLYIYGPKKSRMGPPYFMDPPHLKRHR